MTSTAIGIDLGGTRIKGVVINSSGEILAQKYQQIEKDNWKQVIIQVVEELTASVPGEHLAGISAPGIPDKDNSCIAHMPGRLAGLEGLHWSHIFGRETWVANDAIAAMAAEAKFGAARGVNHAVMLTLGTGVGGAILINGQIYQGAFEAAGHPCYIRITLMVNRNVAGMPCFLEGALVNLAVN